MMRNGYVTGPILGALWLVVIASTLAVTMSFATGALFRPLVLFSMIWGHPHTSHYLLTRCPPGESHSTTA